jgi:hypothetical protein
MDLRVALIFLLFKEDVDLRVTLINKMLSE